MECYLKKKKKNETLTSSRRKTQKKNSLRFFFLFSKADGSTLKIIVRTWFVPFCCCCSLCGWAPDAWKKLKKELFDWRRKEREAFHRKTKPGQKEKRRCILKTVKRKKEQVLLQLTRGLREKKDTQTTLRTEACSSPSFLQDARTSNLLPVFLSFFFFSFADWRFV